MNEELQLFKENIIRDKRRRYLYLNKDQTKGHHIPESYIKQFSFMKNNQLIALLVFIIPYGVFRQNLVLSLAAAAAVYLGMWAFSDLYLLGKFPQLKVSTEDMMKIQTLPFQQTLRSQLLADLLLGFSVLFVIGINTLSYKRPQYEVYIAIVVASILVGYLVYTFLKFWKVKQKIKILQ